MYHYTHHKLKNKLVTPHHLQPLAKDASSVN